ncbi:protein Mis18-beta [Acanthochromis polyacanthus]|uniref:Mis18 domain-containing protein n=1 Tax=Acanthochromis polyacanthus TaxID=80966 RepID=A0A3Q1GV48_9TELE|nr:protein Mis18-beta [Acanthochromis polyacanthus]
MEFNEITLIQREDETKLGSAEELTTRMTLHCQQCNRVLSDSFSICGEVKCMDSVMCLKVTNDVVVSELMEVGHKGDMANCIYSSLECRGCCSAVGKVVHSAPSRLAAVRSIFLLYKANISCYILNSRSMVKASTLTFKMKPLTKSLDEVKQQFKAQLDHMSLVKSRLADRSLTSEFNK